MTWRQCKLQRAPALLSRKSHPEHDCGTRARRATAGARPRWTRQPKRRASSVASGRLRPCRFRFSIHESRIEFARPQASSWVPHLIPVTNTRHDLDRGTHSLNRHRLRRFNSAFSDSIQELRIESFSHSFNSGGKTQNRDISILSSIQGTEISFLESGHHCP